MKLNLEGRGLDARVAEEVNEDTALEVGNTNVLGDALVRELLKSLPGLPDGDLG